MSDKGLSNNPKVRVKVANKYKAHREYFGAKARQMSDTTVKSAYGSKYDTERHYHKRLAQFNKSYQTGKGQFSNPVPNPKAGETYDKKISANKGNAYSNEPSVLSHLTSSKVVRFIRYLLGKTVLKKGQV